MAHVFPLWIWWGMDFNAYVFLYSMVLVSIPGAFFASYYTIGDTVRQAGLLVYAVVLYTAFIGRLIFYYHFHDIYNHLLLLGRHADKKNFADIFSIRITASGFTELYPVCRPVLSGIIVAACSAVRPVSDF